jgi:hypothetical protein
MHNAPISAVPVAAQPTTTPMEPITLSLDQFKAVSGLNDTKARRLVATGEIDSVRIGKQRFVILASYHAYLERLRIQQAQQFANSPGAPG